MTRFHRGSRLVAMALGLLLPAAALAQTLPPASVQMSDGGYRNGGSTALHYPDASDGHARVVRPGDPLPVTVGSSALPSGGATAANQTSANTKLDTLHTDLTSATPAGENHIGEVGGNNQTTTIAQTVTASSAYAAGNAIGGLMTVTNAARVAAGSGLLQSVLEYSKSAQTTQTDVFVFSANPTGSTCTDKTAFVLASADFDKIIGVAHITDWTAGNVASVGQAQGMTTPFALASGTSVFACAVTRSTPTFTATTDISFGFRFLRN